MSALDDGYNGAQAYSNAFSLGVAQQALQRSNLAQQALVNMYGPTAGDPQAALQVQDAIRAQQLTPLLVQNQGLQNQQLGQNINYLSQYYPLALQSTALGNQAQGITNTFNTKNMPAVLKTNEAAASTATTDSQLKSGQQFQAAMYGLTSALSQGLASGNVDPGTLFDSTAATIAKSTGLPVDQLGGLRAQFVQDPAGTLQRLSTAATGAALGTLGPAGRLQMGILGLNMQKTQAEIGQTQADTANKIATHAGTVADAQNAYVALQPQQDLLTAAQTTLPKTMTALQAMSGSPLMNSIVANYVGQGPAADFKGFVTQLHANLSVQQLNAMRAEGGAMGRLTGSEFNNFADAVANIGPDKTFAVNMNALKTIQKYLPDMQNALDSRRVITRQQILALGGSVPGESALNTVPGLPQMPAGANADVPTQSAQLFSSLIVPQESHGQQFNADGSVLLSAKVGATNEHAVGISQMLPSTGPEAAQLAGLPWDAQRFQTDAGYNAALGLAYFHKEMQTFGGNPLLAAAAYNSGDKTVTAAIQKSAQTGQPWVTYLPAETQKYVSNAAIKLMAGMGGTAPGGGTGTAPDAAGGAAPAAATGAGSAPTGLAPAAPVAAPPVQVQNTPIQAPTAQAAAPAPQQAPAGGPPPDQGGGSAYPLPMYGANSGAGMAAAAPNVRLSAPVGNTGFTMAQVLQAANDAVRAGKDPKAVLGRLQALGIDPGKVMGTN